MHTCGLHVSHPGYPLRHPHRPLQFGAAMRGQRPALSGLLLWVALAVVMLGALPMLGPAGTPEVEATLQTGDAGDRGGEVPLPEQAPMTLRRTALHTPVPAKAAPGHARVDIAPSWALLDLPMTRCALQSNHWSALHAAPPTAEAPGRRQQRGQAPPQA